MPQANREASRQLRNDFARHIRQALHPAVVEVCELSMIQTELVKNRRVKVVDGVGLHGGAVAEFIGGTDDLTAFDASSSQPD